MSPFRYRDDSSTGTTVASILLGAVAGFAVGMFVAQRVGGFGGLTSKFRKRLGEDRSETRYATHSGHFDAEDEVEDEIEEEPEDITAAAVGDDDVPLLEERVLEAFNNDPILAERAIDIGTLGSGIIELAGWVDNDAEAEHAMTIARGVPEVDTVVNRLMIDDEERQIDDTIQRFRGGDPALTDSRWEGQQVGTGKRRQGTSDEPDRHADPKPKLEERWLSEREAVRNSAADLDEITAERRKGGRKKASEPQPEA
jgi:osmotically-inducible protein OsmY